jgi:class 3 adenylate cyclase
VVTPLRTTVVMKTDISGSTARFRELLASDLQLLLGEHRGFLDDHAVRQGGRIIKPAGDGFWLEFPSVTAAAKAAIDMQEALRLAQPGRGDDRLAIRIVIALGDVGVQDNDFIGDVFALATRIEAITPRDEIYLSAAASLALTSAEIQTAPVGDFAFKGYANPMPIFRIEQRHRTRVIANALIMFLDLHGFGRLMDTEPASAAVERLLDTLDLVTHGAAREFGGTVRFSVGDSYCLTFAEAAQAMACAETMCRNWDARTNEDKSGCTVSIGLHRGTLYMFRSFLYGRDTWIASQLQGSSARLLAQNENGVFVSGVVRAALADTPWHSRLRPVALQPAPPALASIDVYRLAWAAT